MQFSIKTGITLVGASKFTKADLNECLKFAPKLVAVDGGANRLQRLKMTPDFLVGDMTLLIVWIIYQKAHKNYSH